MRCFYLSDLHLEHQEFSATLPSGDVLIIAGDLCNAKYLDAKRTDIYSKKQQYRVRCFVEHAVKRFSQVLFVAGNHEHYECVFDDTIPLLRDNLPGVDVLDNTWVDVEGVRFFGATLWTDFEGRSAACMDGVRRNVGEFLLVKKRVTGENGEPALRKFQPEDALAEFDEAMTALRACRDDGFDGPLVVVSHHAPSLQGLNPLHKGNGLDGAFASDLEEEIKQLKNMPY